MTNVPDAKATPLLDGRTRHTRWLVILAVPLLALVAPAPRSAWIGDLMETLGVICLVICLVGRGWCSLYIAGRKDAELVTIGPYSVTRNPLYVFSFIGVVGVGLIMEVMTVLAIAGVIFAVYYSIVVRREEAFIGRLHGDDYRRYFTRVPRWIPDFSNWRDADSITVRPKLVLTHLLDSSLFFISFVLFESLEVLREAHILKPLLTLP